MIRLRMVYCGLILVLLGGVIGGCRASPKQAEQPTYWPAGEWRISTPEEHGLDSGLILAMLDKIQNDNLAIHSILIVRHGYLVTEVYFPPYQQGIRHPAYSMTKSFTSAMVGKALQEGYIKSIHQKVLEFFPDIAQDTTDPRREDITIENLLTMSAGYNTNTMPDLYSKDASFDTIRHILTYNSVLVPPGTSFYYDSGLPHLLSAVIQKNAGMTLQDYAEQNLFQPLGITDYTWESDPRGITNGATGLTLRPRDMAKFGYLFLHHGEWNGTQLLPAEWVEASTSKHIETKGLMNAAEEDGYGYLWWIDSFGGYSAHGFGGQYVFVLPLLDMVVVFTSGLPESLFPMPNQLVRNYLIPAAKEDGPLIPHSQVPQWLADRVRAIEQGEPHDSVLPESARRITGKTFRADQVPPGGMYVAFTLTFTGEGTYQNKIQFPGGQTILVTGSLNQVFHLNQVRFLGPPAQDLLIPLRGYWQDEVTFVEDYIQNLNTDIDLMTNKYTFEGDKVIIETSSRMSDDSFQMVWEMVK
jgi:CubicO group peptidase (beta-lactamase class C family)